MNPISFKDLYVGNYFRSIYTGAMFVKADQFSAAAIKLNGLRDIYELDTEFDDDMLVLVLSESEWPDCTPHYIEEIRNWAWAEIMEKMENNAIFDCHDDEPKYTAWLGTTLGVMPSGKIYAMWTSNQTAEDVNRDQCFNEAMEKVFAEKKVFVDWGDSGDLFATRSATWQEIAEKAGYRIEEENGQFYYDGPEDSNQYFEWDDDAWKACCIDNKLVEEIYP